MHLQLEFFCGSDDLDVLCGGEHVAFAALPTNGDGEAPIKALSFEIGTETRRWLPKYM